jgi:N-acetylneuraminate synthase
LSKENVRCVRPGLGLPPKYLNHVLGLTVKKDLKKGTPITWDFLLDK